MRALRLLVCCALAPLTLSGLLACEPVEEDQGLAPGAPVDQGLGQPWEVDSTYSPTGTLLLPGEDTAGPGYAVIDEVCGGELGAADYADRFLTPMFRDIAVAGEVAWLVDGSHLWTLDLSDPEAPVRIGLHSIEGHPVAVHAAASTLWIATIDAGLRGYALKADGLIQPNDEAVLFDEPGLTVMDVDGAGDEYLGVALGAGGVAGVWLDPETGEAIAATQAPAGPFAVAVRVTEDRLVAASCDRIWSYHWTEGLAHEVDFAVAFGSAKNLEVVGDLVYVAAGETMQAYRLGDEPTYLGYYFADEPGFYVNELVAGDGVLYLAAGDQSVRALDVEDVPLAEGTPISWAEPAATVDGPMETTVPAGSVHEIPKDPIAIDLVGDQLLVLGNFRYLGERTLELLDVSEPTWLRPRGAYVQPNVLAGATRVDAQTLVVHGYDDAHRVIHTSTGQVLEVFELPGVVADTEVRDHELFVVPIQGPLARARWVDGALDVTTLTAAALVGRGVAVAADRAFVSDALSDSILTFGAADGAFLGAAHADDAFLGDAALAVYGQRLVAYDRILGQILVFDATADPAPALLGRLPVGLCEAYDIADFYAGSSHARARLLDVAAPTLLCPRQADGGAALLRLSIDADDGPALVDSVALPAQTWADASLLGETLALVGFDDNRYETTVLTLDATTGGIHGTVRLSGHGNAVDLTDDAVYLIDGDFGLWTLDRTTLLPAGAGPLAL